MSYEFGNNLKIEIYGTSHGPEIGVIASGLPAGERIDMDELYAFMSRRKPGKNAMSTPRKEADMPVIVSGLEDGVTTGGVFRAVIKNTDTRSGDYSAFADTPRPGHADYTAFVKWQGKADMRGGGQFSGRLTAPMCIIGGAAKQILARRGIYIGAHLKSVGDAEDEAFPLIPAKALFDEIAAKELPVINDAAGEAIRRTILAARAEGDSVGGVIECAAVGVPAGLGDAMFGGIEGRLAFALFGIPAVKGVEFGAGFNASKMRGSENNDPFAVDESGNICTLTNNCGGILGGITDGMPLTLRVSMKPTPSIAKTQRTVSLSRGENAELSIKGRHDPCVAHRAVPVVEAITAAVLLDIMCDQAR